MLGDAVFDDSLASRVAFIVSESQHEWLVERRRRVLEAEAKDLVRVAALERVQRFAEPQRRTVEMRAEDREQLFVALHERERIP